MRPMTLPTPPMMRPMIRPIRRTIRPRATTNNSSSNRMDSSRSKPQSNSCRNCSNGSSSFSSREFSREHPPECASSPILECRTSRAELIPLQLLRTKESGAYSLGAGGFLRGRNIFRIATEISGLASASVGGTGLAGGEHRLLFNALPRLVRESMKNSDDGAVCG